MVWFLISPASGISHDWRDTTNRLEHLAALKDIVANEACGVPVFPIGQARPGRP